MTAALTPITTRDLSFEAFLLWDDGSDRDFELLDGVPVPLSEPNANHEDVSDELNDRLLEIVSTNWRDDYMTKLAEYEELGIAKYWIVDFAALGGTRFIGDPKQATVSIYSLVNGEYQVCQFRAEERLVSTIFPDLALTPIEIFSAAQ